MIGQVEVSLERQNICQQIGHAAHYARFGVQVNARSNVSALNARACNYSGMKDGWFLRLCEAVRRDERSLNQISLDAGLGRNYVQQMIKEEKKPGTDRLLRLLDVLGRNDALYIYTGLRVDPEDVEFLEIGASLSPAAKVAAKRMLEVVAAEQGGEGPAHAPDPAHASKG